MSAKKAKTEETSGLETPEVEEEITGKALDVQTRDGGFVRTYSQDKHGKQFQSFAEEFAKKIGGKVVKH